MLWGPFFCLLWHHMHVYAYVCFDVALISFISHTRWCSCWVHNPRCRNCGFTPTNYHANVSIQKRKAAWHFLCHELLLNGLHDFGQSPCHPVFWIWRWFHCKYLLYMVFDYSCRFYLIEYEDTLAHVYIIWIISCLQSYY